MSGYQSKLTRLKRQKAQLEEAEQASEADLEAGMLELSDREFKNCD